MKPRQKKFAFIHICFLLYLNSSFAQITLSHNVGNAITNRDIHGCGFGNVYWARTFTLEDFGISPGKDFIISSGEAAVTYENTNWDSRIQFNIYSIDSNFPTSFNESNLIGSSQAEDVWMTNTPIYTLNFETPVIVPHNVERILVEVHQLGSNNSQAVLFCAGTDVDNDISWFKGCANPPLSEYTNTVAMNYPNARFYITVKGNEAEPSMNIRDFSNIKTVIFPNPAKDILNIDSQEYIIKYEIRNLLSQIILQGKLETSQSTILINDISKGTYLLSLETAEGLIITRKIIKD